MQICYRCSPEIHSRLTEKAHEKETSRNRLIDTVIRSYLDQEPDILKNPCPSCTSAEIHSAVCLASEKLAEILEAVNRIPLVMDSETGSLDITAFCLLRRELMDHLLEIAESLRLIRRRETNPHV